MLPTRGEFLRIVREHANGMIITSHMHPDDDSMSSVLSLQTLLAREGIRLPIIYPSEERERWKTIPGYDEIRFAGDLTTFLESPEGENVQHILLVDAARVSALTNREGAFEKIREERGIRFLILDHHETAEMHGELLHVQEPGLTSTAELIARILLTDTPVDTRLAEQLLLGILGDTGNLRYVTPSQSSIFLLVKRLVDEGGVHIDAFKSRYERVPYATFSRLAQLLENARLMHLPGWPPFILVVNRLQEADEASSTAKDLMTVFLKQTREAEWGVIFNPRQGGRVSLSLRSTPHGIRVVDLVKAMGIGGGHAYAAGGVINTPLLDDAVQIFLKYLQEHSWDDVQRIAQEMDE